MLLISAADVQHRPPTNPAHDEGDAQQRAPPIEPG
jgi:hypothetical protein